LPDAGDEAYADVLREIVRADLEFHWRSGQPKMVEAYLGAFPALGKDRAGLAEIAFEEFRLRRRAGQTPSADEYLTRLGVDLSSRLAWPAPADGPVRHDADGLVQGHRPEGRDAGLQARPAVELLDEARCFEGFRLSSELGRGSFARVYLARQDDLADRLVVLKVSPHITGEEISLAQLQHTHIVPVHSVHRAGPLHAICMPYFGATTFADVVRELQARGSPPDSARWLIDLVRRRRRTGDPVSEKALLDLERRSYVDAVLVLAAQLAEALGY